MFAKNIPKCLKALFYRTTPGDGLCTSWRKIARDVLALRLMADFKEC